MLRSRNLFIISGAAFILVLLLLVINLMTSPPAVSEVPPPGTEPGSFFLTTSSESISVGGQYTLQLQVRSDIPANTYSASISFPPELLQVIEVDYEDGVVDLWIHEPSFDNEAGTISLAGGSLRQDGFLGEDTLLTFVIEPLQTGTIDLMIKESAMYAHDGAGTEIPLEETGPLSLTITN